MTIDLYTATGTKKGSLELPASLFDAEINKGLMHLALVRQQSNRRTPIAHVLHRGEIVGSTKKVYQQKHTGQARRGPIRSPLMKGGGKAFGPRNEANFYKGMPKKMRRAALASCLSFRAKSQAIIGLEDYATDATKTKQCAALLKKLPVDIGRSIVIVTPGPLHALERAARNIPGVSTVRAQYLNPEAILGAHKIIFMKDAVAVAEQTFVGTSKGTNSAASEPVTASESKKKVSATKKATKTVKKPASKTAKKASSSTK